MPAEEKSEETTDVKETEESSTEEPEAKEEEVDLDEEDAKSLDDKQRIPYSRFKEVNESKKSLESLRQ